jgi:hypothetical protein
MEHNNGINFIFTSNKKKKKKKEGKEKLENSDGKEKQTFFFHIFNAY